LNHLVHTEDIHDLYFSPNIIQVIKSRRMRRAGHVARKGNTRGAHKVLVGKPDRKSSLERPGRRWEDNDKMTLEVVR
jgi:hypothetical protein